MWGREIEIEIGIYLCSLKPENKILAIGLACSIITKYLPAPGGSLEIRVRPWIDGNSCLIVSLVFEMLPPEEIKFPLLLLLSYISQTCPYSDHHFQHEMWTQAHT